MNFLFLSSYESWSNLNFFFFSVKSGFTYFKFKLLIHASYRFASSSETIVSQSHARLSFPYFTTLDLNSVKNFSSSPAELMLSSANSRY